MTGAPLHLKFRADLFEPIAHFLLKGERDAECIVEFKPSADRLWIHAERQLAGFMKVGLPGFVGNRSATLNFGRAILARVSSELLLRLESWREDQIMIEIKSSPEQPWLCEVRFVPPTDNPADLLIYHVAEVDASLEEEAE